MSSKLHPRKWNPQDWSCKRCVSNWKNERKQWSFKILINLFLSFRRKILKLCRKHTGSFAHGLSKERCSRAIVIEISGCSHFGEVVAISAPTGSDNDKSQTRGCCTYLHNLGKESWHFCCKVSESGKKMQKCIHEYLEAWFKWALPLSQPASILQLQQYRSSRWLKCSRANYIWLIVTIAPYYVPLVTLITAAFASSKAKSHTLYIIALSPYLALHLAL